jgi:hypothetical protein
MPSGNWHRRNIFRMTERTQFGNALFVCHAPVSGHPNSAYVDSRLRGNDKMASLDEANFAQIKPTSDRKTMSNPTIHAIQPDHSTHLIVNVRAEHRDAKNSASRGTRSEPTGTAGERSRRAMCKLWCTGPFSPRLRPSSNSTTSQSAVEAPSPSPLWGHMASLSAPCPHRRYRYVPRASPQ